MCVQRLLSSGACCWSRLLVDVEDDLESRYLAAQRSKLEFALTVPHHGALLISIDKCQQHTDKQVAEQCVLRVSGAWGSYCLLGRMRALTAYAEVFVMSRPVLTPHVRIVCIVVTSNCPACCLSRSGGGCVVVLPL